MAKSKTSQKIQAKNVRFAFVQIDKAKPYEVGQKDYFTLDVLLDPANAEHAATIATIKEEGKKLALEAYGSIDGIKNKCFGKGDDRKRAGTNDTYDGYAGMFYVKLKAHADRNAIGGEHFGFVANRQAKTIGPQDPQWPYSGCYGNVSFTMWALDPKSPNIRHGKSIGGNLLSLQFVRDGEAFGGAGPVRVEDEFEALPDDGGATAAAVAGGAGAPASTSEWDD